MGDTDPTIPSVSGTDDLLGLKLGDYQVEELIAQGGMGLVYRARHPLLGKKAAVKVLREKYAHDQQQIDQFLKEAQAISAIHHRGIIDVINFGHLADGRQFMVMEFLDGETLEAVLQRDAPLPAARALPIIDEVLDALSAAHKVGVVHRDLKPSNVFMALQSNGIRYAKLVDFGLARRAQLSDSELSAPTAKASVVAGTPEYIAPEQARGYQVTPRSDLYSLGVMLFEMVTGRLPYAAPTVMGLLQAHAYSPIPRASTVEPSVPPDVDELIATLMAKDPEARPRSADVVRQEVARSLKRLKDASTHMVAVPRRPSSPTDNPFGLEDTVRRSVDLVTPGPLPAPAETLETDVSGPRSSALSGSVTAPAGGPLRVPVLVVVGAVLVLGGATVLAIRAASPGADAPLLSRRAPDRVPPRLPELPPPALPPLPAAPAAPSRAETAPAVPGASPAGPARPAQPQAARAPARPVAPPDAAEARPARVPRPPPEIPPACAAVDRRALLTREVSNARQRLESRVAASERPDGLDTEAALVKLSDVAKKSTDLLSRVDKVETPEDCARVLAMVQLWERAFR